MTAPRDSSFSATLALLTALALAGCQSASLEDLAPLPGARNTGTTPDLNVPQKAETNQFTDADRAAKTSELAAARASQQGAAQPGPAPAGTADALRKASQLQAETLKEIEGE